MALLTQLTTSPTATLFGSFRRHISSPGRRAMRPASHGLVRTMSLRASRRLRVAIGRKSIAAPPEKIQYLARPNAVHPRVFVSPILFPESPSLPPALSAVEP